MQFTYKKLNLYQLLAELLNLKEKSADAKAHIELIYQIRSSKKWRIDSELSESVKNYGIHTDNLPETKELLKKLKTIWENLKFGSQDLLKGTIKTIISEGRAGFIDSDNKNSYYFSVKAFKGKRELLQHGQRVSFFLEDGFDKKKNQSTKIAVNIKPIE